tara:strand:- start:78878 stop:79102 length:225 start_codon:yes stop_codon:yes gene_type:complete
LTARSVADAVLTVSTILHTVWLFGYSQAHSALRMVRPFLARLCNGADGGRKTGGKTARPEKTIEREYNPNGNFA